MNIVVFMKELYNIGLNMYVCIDMYIHVFATVTYIVEGRTVIEFTYKILIDMENNVWDMART